MQFQYEAFTATGTPVKGIVEADSAARAEELLWDADLTVIKLKRHRRLPDIDEMLPTILGPKTSDVIAFARQMAIILDAGISMLPTLRIIHEQTAKRSMKKVLAQIITQIEEGNLLSTACGRRADVFPLMFVRLLQVGEETGNIEASLRQIATQMERAAAIGQRLRSASVYPAFILALAGVAGFIVLNLVLPSLAGLYTEFHADLPAATRLLIALSVFIRSYAVLVAGVVMLLVAAGLAYYRRPSGRRRFQALLLRLPLVGSITLKGELARFAHTLAVLQAAGVSLIEALDMLVQTTGNVVVADSLLRLRRAVLEGQPISGAMRADRLFPPLIAEMVRVGEETGTLEANLTTVANVYEAETEQATGRLLAMVEPTLIVVVGLVVGFIAVSVISPMYAIMQSIR